MKLLVLGAGGQFGTELCAMARADDIIAIGQTRNDLNIVNRAALDAALRRHEPAVVVNAAAYTAVERAEQEPEEACRVNAEGAENVAAACARVDAALIHISTDYVFDGRKGGAYTEEDAVNPLCAYARSKAEGEAAVRAAADRHVILRSAWLYGIHGRNFLKTMLLLAAEGRELRVVDDQYGSPTGTADLAQATLLVAHVIGRGEENIWGTYHFAGTGATTWHGFASEIVERRAALTGRRVPVRAITSAEYGSAVPRPANSALDSSKFAARFGLRARRWQERTAEVVAALAAVARNEDVA